MPKGKKSKVDGAQLRVAVGRPRKHPAQPPPEEEGEGEADVAGPLPDVPAEPLQSSPTPLTAERALTVCERTRSHAFVSLHVFTRLRSHSR